MLLHWAHHSGWINTFTLKRGKTLKRGIKKSLKLRGEERGNSRKVEQEEGQRKFKAGKQMHTNPSTKFFSLHGQMQTGCFLTA